MEMSAPRPFTILTRMYPDPELSAIFDEHETVSRWLEVEVALAWAQADSGFIPRAAAEDIEKAATMASIDLAALWREAANVGYPILPLVRMVDDACMGEGKGRVHFGATTQDIMDSALVLQLRNAGECLLRRIDDLGNALADLVRRHGHTIMPARTHGQQAVPTTFGVKCAVFLDEVARQRIRLRAATDTISVVSLFGAAGTSAGFGSDADRVRESLARQLGLSVTDVPWHVARDRFVEFGTACASLCGTLARFAREIADLSRTEIGEVREPVGHHRGASSTMPQKSNPIWCEAVLGFAGTTTSLTTALLRAMEAGHERAAGEWQIEWQVLPEVATFTGTAVMLAAQIAHGLHVDAERMAANLSADHGTIMAEAYMLAIADRLGREAAHDLVYEAVGNARSAGVPLHRAVVDAAPDGVREMVADMAPEDYVGSPESICSAALRSWSSATAPEGEAGR